MCRSVATVPLECCSVLQCVAVCSSVLQCVAVCCSVLQCVAVCCSVLPCVAVIPQDRLWAVCRSAPNVPLEFCPKIPGTLPNNDCHKSLHKPEDMSVEFIVHRLGFRV